MREERYREVCRKKSEKCGEPVDTRHLNKTSARFYVLLLYSSGAHQKLAGAWRRLWQRLDRSAGCWDREAPGGYEYVQESWIRRPLVSLCIVDFCEKGSCFYHDFTTIHRRLCRPAAVMSCLREMEAAMSNLPSRGNLEAFEEVPGTFSVCTFWPTSPSRYRVDRYRRHGPTSHIPLLPTTDDVSEKKKVTAPPCRPSATGQ